MKTPGTVLTTVLFVALSSCGPKHGHDHAAMSGDSANAALNVVIMAKHDEVMPLMGDLYNFKKKLMDTLARTPSLPADKKAMMEALIMRLDSVNQSMMDWMHGYDPNHDSTDQEKNRAYLEEEIEKINRIGEETMEAIEKAKAVTGHK